MSLWVKDSQPGKSTLDAPVARSGFSFSWVLIAGFAFVWLLAPFLAIQSGGAAVFFTREEGFVENLTVILLAIAALMFFFGPYDLPRKKWMLGAVCLLFFAREFDINKNIARRGFAFFPDDFKGNFPLGYAIVETVSVIGILCLIAYMAWSYRRIVVANLKRFDRHQIMLLMVWVCVGISLMLDGVVHRHEWLFGEDPLPWVKQSFEAIEEGTEMMIPFCIILGLLEYYRTRIWTKQAPRYDVSP